MRTGPGRLARIVAVVGCLVLTLLIVRAVPTSFAEPKADAWVYLAAGERLNAGHDLYSLVPGDRPVRIVPPLWPSALLSPPPVAVAWRPLALLGDWAMGLWCAGAIVASLALLAWGVLYGGPWSLAAVVLFGPFLLYAAIPGNANGYLAPLLALAWLQRHRPWLPALAVVTATAVKVTPVALGPWLLERRRLLWAAGISIAGILLTLVGAPGAMSEWFGSSGQPVASPLSAAGMLGTDPRTTTIVIVAASWVLGLALRRHERAVFVVGLIGMTFASPAFYLHTLALLTPVIVVDRAQRVAVSAVRARPTVTAAPAA